MGARPVLLDIGGNEVPIVPSGSGGCALSASITGELALEMPMLGTSQRLLNADHNAVYYAGMPRPGLRRHGDEVQALPGGLCRAHGRTDDTMNLGGIKVSSVELERAVMERVPGVVEAAAIAVPPPDGGPDRLVVFLVMLSDDTKVVKNEACMDGLKHACQSAISARLNPLFRVGGVEVVNALPRTASNKVMRRVLRDRLLQPGADDGVRSKM